MEEIVENASNLSINEDVQNEIIALEAIYSGQLSSRFVGMA